MIYYWGLIFSINFPLIFIHYRLFMRHGRTANHIFIFVSSFCTTVAGIQIFRLMQHN